MNAGELIFDIVFHADTKKLKDLIKDLGELNLSSILSSKALKEFVTGLKNIMDQADRLARPFNSLAALTGISAKEFQQWDNAAQKFNVTAGTTGNSIAGIQEAIAAAKFGDPSKIANWGTVFGVNPLGRENDPQGLMHDILANLQKFRNMGESIGDLRERLIKGGLDQELVKLVGHQDEWLKEVSNTTEQFAQMQEYQKKLVEYLNTIKSLVLDIGAALSPLFGPLLDDLAGFLKFIGQVEQGLPKWIPPLLTIAGIIAALGIMTKANPFLLALSAGILGAGYVQSLLSGQLTPKTSTTGNTETNGDINFHNQVTITGASSEAENMYARMTQRQIQIANDQRARQNI